MLVYTHTHLFYIYEHEDGGTVELRNAGNTAHVPAL
jgi:hypothetical protein